MRRFFIFASIFLLMAASFVACGDSSPTASSSFISGANGNAVLPGPVGLQTFQGRLSS